jgi:hypothetical protein
MGITEKEFCDAVHLNIHSVRLLTGYKPTEFEKRISKLVLEKYVSSCKECKEIDEKLKANPTQDKPSLLKKIGNAINNAP